MGGLLLLLSVLEEDTRRQQQAALWGGFVLFSDVRCLALALQGAGISAAGQRAVGAPRSSRRDRPLSPTQPRATPAWSRAVSRSPTELGLHFTRWAAVSECQGTFGAILHPFSQQSPFSDEKEE